MAESISNLDKFIFVDKLDPFVHAVPSFIQGDFKDEFLKEYNYYKKKLGDLKFLNIFVDEAGKLAGSNAPSLILTNQILGKYGLRTIGFGEIDQVKNDNKFNSNSNYIDLGFLIMGYGRPNKDIFKDFKDQLVKKKYLVGEEPILVYPWEIKLKKNLSKPCGLDFKLRGDAKLRYFPDMEFNNNGKSIGSIGEVNFNFNRIGRIKFLASSSGLTRITLENNTFLRANGSKLMHSNHIYKMVLTQK